MELKYNTLINYPKFEWSINYLTEQNYLDLISATAYDGITRIYEQQAKWYIRRAPILKPSPVFVVFRKHLSKRVKLELAQLHKTSPKTLDDVMKRSIEMIFEGITEQSEEIFNSRNYFLSIKRYNLLQWRFDTNDEDAINLNFDINNFENFTNKRKTIDRVSDQANRIKQNDINRK